MRRAIVLGLLLLGCDAATALEDAGAPPPDAGVERRAWLTDDEGGVVILRGSNVEGASKWTEGSLPPHFETEADFARLQGELGMNAVRFLIFWEAVEPERGTYDDAYLAEVRRRVEAAGAAGLHVVIDMHQDVFGRGFGGDGAPRWACDEALYASFERPDEWYLGYFAPEVQACFDRLWQDPDTRAALGAAWGYVAAALRGADGLFAYELINEPHWGTSAIRAFERDLLPAAYAEWIAAIRAADPDPWILVGPASTANVGLSSDLRPPDAPRVAYAPHVYPPSLEQGEGWSEGPGAVRAFTESIEDDAARMGLPAVVTETGGRVDVPGVLVFLEQAYAAFDAARLGVFQWEAGPSGGYGLYDDEGAPTALAEAVARPYPSRTRGVPTAWSWDADARVFEVAWIEDAFVPGATEIALPALACPDGADVTLDDGGAAIVDRATVRIDPGPAGPRHARIVCR